MILRLLAFILFIWSSNGYAQTCPTRPTGDNTNACASTAFVGAAIGGQGLGALAYLNAGTGLASAAGNLNCSAGTGTTIGCVRPDGTTITVSSGVLSVVSASPTYTLTGKYAASCGVVTDGVTDDTAAWNICIAYANAHPGTALIASPGTSIISAVNAFTANNSYITCPNGPGACIISHSGNNALTWNSAATGGGLINIGLNNTGSACNISIVVDGGAGQLSFNNLVLGTGVGELAELGISGSSPAERTQWVGLTSPNGLANVACPLFSLTSGAGFILQNSVLFVPSAGVSGRAVVSANITATSWATVYLQGNLLQYFYNTVVGTLNTTGYLVDAKIDNNYLTNCVGPCINLLSTNSSTISSWTISNNWMDNNLGTTDCLDITQGTGNGNIIGIQILGNRISTCGANGIDIGGTGTPTVEEIMISNNMIYNVNVLNTGTTNGILVEGDGVDSIFNSVQIIGNQVSSPGWSSFFSPYYNPTYGIAVNVTTSGGPGVQYATVVGNTTIGTTADFRLPATSSSSRWESNNIGETGTSITVGTSTFTYQAGNRPETVYIRGGTVSSVVQTSTTICTTTNCTVYLAPNQSIAVTYSSTPTMVSIAH